MMGAAAPIGVKARSCICRAVFTERRQGCLEMAFGLFPIAAPFIDRPQLVLDGRQRSGLTECCGSFVAAQRRVIFAKQGMQVANSLVSAPGSEWPSASAVRKCSSASVLA